MLSHPDSSLVAVGADEAVDVFTVCDELLARGWYAQPQMRFGPFPATLHLSLSAATVPQLPEFLQTLADAVAAAAARGPVPVDPGVTAALAGLDPATLDDEGFDQLLVLAGLAGAGGLALPERMAPVNALLDAAPPGSARRCSGASWTGSAGRPAGRADPPP